MSEQETILFLCGCMVLLSAILGVFDHQNDKLREENRRLKDQLREIGGDEE